MGSGMRTFYSHTLNKGFSSEFLVGYLDQHTPYEGQQAQRLKHCDNKKKDEGNSPHVSSENKVLF